MTVQQGMDSARIRQISGQLDNEVTKLGDVLARGNSSAGLLEENWAGDDGQKLLVRWRSDALKQISSASEMLRSASKDLQRQADQQEDASGEARGGPGGPGGSGGPGSTRGPGGRQGPGAGDEGQGPEAKGEWDPYARDEESAGIRTNTDGDGNKHHYDPVTGKTWVEAEDGSWKEERGALGHDKRTTVEEREETRNGETHTSTHESTRGEGGGQRSWGEKWTNEWTDEGYEKPDKRVWEEVQTEPLAKQELWEQEAHAAAAEGGFTAGDLTGHGEVLSARAGTSGEAGLDLKDGAYVKANAEAGAYLARGELNYANDYGTSANAEGYIGAEAAAEGQASLGPGGAKVEAGLEAFAGGKVEAGVTQDVGDYGSVGASGELSYGIGAHANVDGEISADKVGLSVDVGATLGIGGGVKFDVSVSPKEIIGDIGDAGEAVADSKLNPMNWGW